MIYAINMVEDQIVFLYWIHLPALDQMVSIKWNKPLQLWLMVMFLTFNSYLSIVCFSHLPMLSTPTFKFG